MPVIGCGTDDGVDVLVVHDLAEVRFGGELVDRPAGLPQIADSVLDATGIDVAQANDIEVGYADEVAQVGPAHAAAADEGDVELLGGRNGAGRVQARGYGGRGGEEMAAR